MTGLAIAVHRSEEVAAGDRGRAFGRAHVGAVRHTVAVYRRMLAEVAGLGPADLHSSGAAVGVAIGERFGDLVDELEGMADGSGVAVEDLLAVNARTELLGGRGQGECTVIATARDGEATITQTWDWHPDLAASRVVWTVVQPDGEWHATLTEAGILAKVGLSSAGVASGLNFLTCSEDGGVGGVPVHVLLRVVLDRCGSLVEALGTLTRAQVTASSTVTLAAVEDDVPLVAAVELSPGGAAVLLPDENGRLVHANHFLRPPARGVDTQPRDHPSSLLRMLLVERALVSGVEPTTALRCHSPTPESVCRHPSAADAWADRRATLAALELRPAVPSFRLADGAPCSSALEPIPLP